MGVWILISWGALLAACEVEAKVGQHALVPQVIPSGSIYSVSQILALWRKINHGASVWSSYIFHIPNESYINYPNRTTDCIIVPYSHTSTLHS